MNPVIYAIIVLSIKKLNLPKYVALSLVGVIGWKWYKNYFHQEIEKRERNVEVGQGRTNSKLDLVTAIKKNNSRVVAALLASGVEVNDQNAMGNSALMIAANLGRYRYCQQLLVAGADPNLQNGRGGLRCY